MIKIAKLKAASLIRHLDYEPSSNIKIVIKFIICTPAPLAGACHHYKVMFYFRLSLHESDTFRGRAWDTELLLLSPGGNLCGRFEITEYGATGADR